VWRDVRIYEALARQYAINSSVLPFLKDDFVPVSVTRHGDTHWSMRFDKILNHAHDVPRITPARFVDDPILSGHASLMSTVLARMQASRLEWRLIGIAVWNGAEGDGAHRHGTAAPVRRWHELGTELHVIPTARVAVPVNTLIARTQMPPTKARRTRAKPGKAFVCGVLFWNWDGFSRVSLKSRLESQRTSSRRSPRPLVACASSRSSTSLQATACTSSSPMRAMFAPGLSKSRRASRRRALGQIHPDFYG